MGLKLYKATVELEIEVLWAGDEPPTEDDILDAAREEIEENWHTCGPGFASDPELVDDLKHLPKEWEKANPYGDHDGSRTCLQILDAYVPDVEPLGEQLSIIDEPG